MAAAMIGKQETVNQVTKKMIHPQNIMSLLNI
jgi:hypothetical protein